MFPQAMFGVLPQNLCPKKSSRNTNEGLPNLPISVLSTLFGHLLELRFGDLP